MEQENTMPIMNTETGTVVLDWTMNLTKDEIMEHTPTEQISCSCCMRTPIHETEKPDWIRFVGRGGVAYYCPEHRDWLDSLQRTPNGAIIYSYRGDVERGHDYHWVAGYSATTNDGGVLYPWNTKQECQRDAKRFGCKAVFVERVNL